MYQAYEELISKTLLHPLLHITHLQLRSQQSQFSKQNLLQMENVDTNWKLEQDTKKFKFYDCKNCFLTLS